MIDNIRFFLFVTLIMASRIIMPGIALAEGRNFTLRGQMATSYDDNITFAHSHAIADFLQTILVGLDFKSEKSRNNFLMQADVSQNFYFHNQSFNNSAVLFRAKDLFEVSERLRLNASESFESTEEPRSFDDAFGRNSGRYRTDRNRFKVGGEVDISSHALGQLSYHNEFTGHSRAGIDDSDLNMMSSRVEYDFDDTNRAGLSYEYALRSYSSGKDIIINSLIVDYGHHFTKQLEWVVKVGEDFIDSEISGRSQQARYEMSLLNDIDEATHAALTYRKGLSTSTYSKNLFDSYQVSASLAREVTQRTALNGSAFYGRGEYRETHIEDKLSGLGLGVSYAVSQKMDVGLDYSFSKTGSTDGTRSFERNFFGANAKFKF